MRSKWRRLQGDGSQLGNEDDAASTYPTLLLLNTLVHRLLNAWKILKSFCQT